MKIKHFVRQSLFFSLFLGGIALPMDQAHSQVLPDIEAHQFKAMPTEMSRTGRVYKFRVDPDQLPRTGSILLIEENDRPLMAFRVMTSDHDRSEFIAKRVRRYEGGDLKLETKYQAAEKIADLVSPPPAEYDHYDPNAKPMLDPNPGRDLVGTGTAGKGGSSGPISLGPDESTPIAPGSGASPDPSGATHYKKPLDVEKYDDELDGSTSPTNLKTDDTVEDSHKKTKSEDDELDPNLGMDLEVKEKSVLMPYRYMLGVNVGTFKNLSGFVGGSDTSAGGFSAYFSHVVDRNLFFKKKAPQDTLSFEYGFAYYGLTNTSGHNDNYTIMPLKWEMRYDMHLSESFTIFLYAGVQYNLIAGSENFSDSTQSIVDAYNAIHGFQANVGAGLFYNIGPQWYLRFEGGLDRLAVGLAVRW